jgi:hypothetical protein
MDEAAELWGCLRRVRAVRFHAHSARATGWNGAGSGEVLVETPAESVLTFTESGTWRTSQGKELRFRNIFRWSLLDPRAVRLEHLRFGPDRPVFLFDLVPGPGRTWVSVRPHLCGEDCYSAELRLEDGAIFLRWAIAGPKKQEAVEYEYQE